MFNGHERGIANGLNNAASVGLAHGLIGDSCDRNTIMKLPNLFAWYDHKFKNLATSNSVLQLIDKSGHERHITAGSPYHTFNDREIITTISTTGFSFPYTINVSNFSLFIVMLSNNQSPRFGIFQYQTSYTYNNILLESGSSGNLISWYNGGSYYDTGTRPPTGKYVILEFHGERGNYKRVIQNGVQLLNASFGGQSVLTGFNFFGGNYYTETSGSFKEFVVFDNRLEDNNKKKVRDILNRKYNIY